MDSVNEVTWLVKYYDKRPLGDDQRNSPIPVFDRLRIVSLHNQEYLSCSCKTYEQMGLPCSHILCVTDHLDLSMCDLRWWKNYLYNYGRTGKLSDVFDKAFTKALPRVPWKRKAHDQVIFPVIAAGTTAQQVSDMLYLYDNRDKVFVKGATRMNDSSNSAGEAVLGLQSSVKMSQVYADDFRMNFADSPASTAKNVPRYQDLLRKFELVYHLAEEDSNDLFKLESLLEDFQISLLAKNEHKNHRNETSKVVSLFPILNKKRKSANFCCKF